METAEAILAIRSNWPDERYTMLREALTKAIAALEEVEAGRTATNSRYVALAQAWRKLADDSSDARYSAVLYGCADDLCQLNAEK